MFQGIPFILMVYIYTMIIRKVRTLRLNLKSHTIKGKGFTSANSSQGTSMSKGKFKNCLTLVYKNNNKPKTCIN